MRCHSRGDRSVCRHGVPLSRVRWPATRACGARTDLRSGGGAGSIGCWLPPDCRGRPYALRHSSASLLLHEGRDVIYVARQLGHGAELTLRTYGHVIEELEDSPQLSTEEAINLARISVGGRSCPRSVRASEGS
jgi:integrase